MSIFEKASQLKLRFEMKSGYITVEDLWDLALTTLDTIAKTVNKKLKEETEESFIAKKSSSSSELELKLEILKHIISYKQQKAEEHKIKIQRMEELNMLEDILADKKTEAVKSLSVEEIQKRITDLRS